jgi:hypothetical protein
MTAKDAFTEEEWETVVEGPTSAGMVVAASQKGGTFRESMAMAKAWTEARKQHGESELLDELVSSRPKMDRTGARSPEELKAHGLENIREALGVLEGKATPEEIEQYKQFTLGLSQKVAEAAKDVSSEEQLAIADIAQTLGLPSPG